MLAVLSLTAAACGLKGPLYRPDEARNESVTSGQPSETTTKKKDTSSGSTQPGEQQNEPPVSPPDPDRSAVPPNR